MKTKAIIIMVLILCVLLSSPLLFAKVPDDECTYEDPGVWSATNNWIDRNIPDDPADKVWIQANCDFDISSETILQLYSDTASGFGTLTVGAGDTLTVSNFVRMGQLTAGGKLNIGGGTTEGTGGTVVVQGANGSSHAVLFDDVGSSATTQINVTDGGLLKLYAASDTTTEADSIPYRYVIKYASEGQDILSTLNVTGTGVMEFYNTIDSRVPAIGHTANAARSIHVEGDGYIKYVGFDAMDMIALDADDDGGVFLSLTGPATTQKYTPEDVTTEDMAYDQDPGDGITGDGIAWFHDGTDTYLFPCKLPDGMTTIDAGVGGSRSVSEGASGVTMDATFDQASDDTDTYTFLWECDPSTGVTYNPSNTIIDPNVSFQSSGTYTLKITATGSPSGYEIVDWVTYSIDVTRAKIMTTHLAIDDGELDAAQASGGTPGEYFKDSSTEGDPENHRLIWFGGGSGWVDMRGVVVCGDNDAIGSDDKGSIKFYLDHNVSGFNEGAAHLDNIDTAITVALWYKGEDDKSQVLIEKQDTWSFEMDNNDDKIQITIGMQGGGDFVFTSKNNDEVGGHSNADLSFRNNENGDEEAWHHLAFSYDSTTGEGQIFADGVMIKDDNGTPGALIVTYPGGLKFLTLGGKMGASDDLRMGGLDDIRIYNYVLEDHEVAALASMGESVALVYAGRSRVTDSSSEDPNNWTSEAVNPNSFPVQLEGAYLKLGRGSTTISNGSNNDNPDERIAWSMQSGTGTATFSNTSDPRSTVTFSEPGRKDLRLTAYERFCGNSNDHYDSVTIEITDPCDCLGVRNLGANYTGDFGNDCEVDTDDLRILGENWLNDITP